MDTKFMAPCSRRPLPLPPKPHFGTQNAVWTNDTEVLHTLSSVAFNRPLLEAEFKSQRTDLATRSLAPAEMWGQGWEVRSRGWRSTLRKMSRSLLPWKGGSPLSRM